MALPKVIVNGIDICEQFSLIWTNDGELQPPEVKFNFKDIPGMDGSFDLTETLAEDVNYGERTQEFVFYVCPGPDFEKTKTLMQNMLHGRAYDYQLSVDPGYTYHGRWECDSYYSRMHYREIKFTVHANPYKRGEHRHIVEQAAGSVPILISNGRRHVSPKITVNREAEVVYGDLVWIIPEAGTWDMVDLRFAEGESILRINTALGYCDTTMLDLSHIHARWDEFPTGARLSDYLFTHSKSENTTIGDVAKMYGKWNKIPASYTLDDLKGLKGEPPTGKEFEVIVDFDVEDL